MPEQPRRQDITDADLLEAMNRDSVACSSLGDEHGNVWAPTERVANAVWGDYGRVHGMLTRLAEQGELICDELSRAFFRVPGVSRPVR